MFKKLNIGRVVILGSMSFIGKSIIAKFHDNNIRPVLISRKQVNFEKNDCFLKLKKILKKNDIIIFVVAVAPVKNVVMLNKNLIIARNIIACLKTIKLKHLIYISSDAVYSDSNKKITENSETVPTSLHGFMHLIRETMLKDLDCLKTFVRPTLVFGHHDPHDGYGPNKFIRCAQLNKKIILFGKGEEKRDHINVDNVASIVFEVVINKIDGIVNAVSGSVISFYEIAKNIKKIYPKTKIQFKKRSVPMPHNGYRAFDNSLLKKKFSNVCIVNLKQWLKNKDKYKII